MRTWEEKYLTQEQIQALLDAVSAYRDAFKDPRRTHAVIFLGFNLGLRISELCLLRRSHFDLHRGHAQLPTLKQSEKIRHACPACDRKAHVSIGRSGKPFACGRCGAISTVATISKKDIPVPLRQVPFLEPATAAYLEEYFQKLPEDQDLLFVKRGGKACTRQDLWRDFRIAAGIARLNNYVPHGMRHGRGQHVMKTTGDIKAVQSALRHKDAKTSMIYVHMMDEAEHRKKLNAKAVGSRPL